MQNKVSLSYTDRQSHSCNADKNPYRHDGRADKDTYRHDGRANSLSLFLWKFVEIVMWARDGTWILSCSLPIPVRYLTCSLSTLSLPIRVRYLAFSLPVFFATLIFFKPTLGKH